MSNHIVRPLAMAALMLSLGAGVSGCSSLDPTGLFDDDDTPIAPDTQFPTDSQQQAQADANANTPDLSALPARPTAPDTKAQADATAQTQAAGAQAQYSADALRAGTEAAAPPPAATDAAAARQALAAADAPPTASPTPAATAPAAPPPPPAAAAAADVPPTASAPAPAAPPPPVAVASAAPPPPPATPEAAAPPPPVAPAAPATAPVASAPIAPPSGGEPAVPAVPMTPAARAALDNPTDAQLGFKPSSAPPLNPSVAQWVSPAILAHYRQTASAAGTAGTAQAAVPAVPASGKGGSAAPGDVIANLNAVPGTPMGMAAANNGGVAPAAIIYFAGDGTSLPASARTQVRDAVAAFKALGGNGSIKVVGHASSRTANMTVERHLEVILQKSQARANVVAQALIKAGVPAAKVQVEAVGDSQPIYYESMPKGEAGNRRAEIYVQG